MAEPTNDQERATRALYGVKNERGIEDNTPEGQQADKLYGDGLKAYRPIDKAPVPTREQLESVTPNAAKAKALYGDRLLKSDRQKREASKADDDSEYDHDLLGLRVPKTDKPTEDADSEDATRKADKPTRAASTDADSDADADDRNGELELPGGIDPDDPLLSEFKQLADDLKVSPGDQKRLLQLHAEVRLDEQDRQQEMINGWEKEAKEDPNFDRDVRRGRAILGEYDPDRTVAELLDQTGLGSHPAVIQFLGRLAGDIQKLVSRR